MLVGMGVGVGVHAWGGFRLYQRSMDGVSGRSRLSDYIARVPRILLPPAGHGIIDCLYVSLPMSRNM
jgi:hypothetical protein